MKGAVGAWDWDLIARAVIPHGAALPRWREDSGCLLLLGDIPRGEVFHMHRMLAFRKGDIYAHDVSFRGGCFTVEIEFAQWVGNDSDQTIIGLGRPDGFDIDAMPLSSHDAAARAYAAARSARFEHGTSGAT